MRRAGQAGATDASQVDGGDETCRWSYFALLRLSIRAECLPVSHQTYAIEKFSVR